MSELAVDKLYDLTCGHCACIFAGSYRKWWNTTQGKKVTCSKACQLALQSKMLSKPIPEGGPCLQCGKKFFSRRLEKKYCSLSCYTASPQFIAQREGWVDQIRKKEPKALAAIAKSAEKNKRGHDVPCLECGELIWRKPSDVGKRKFCGSVCYRAYMAKRFDRWVANPEALALPQCYDEFLDSEVLHCVIEGCSWVGQQLTMHVNSAHGLPKHDFKRAAGFNVNTGVIARPLAEVFQARGDEFQSSDQQNSEALLAAKKARDENPVKHYKSLEGLEHLNKSLAMRRLDLGPERTCLHCGELFHQSTPFGKAMYCSRSCRNLKYAAKTKQKYHERKKAQTVDRQ